MASQDTAVNPPQSVSDVDWDCCELDLIPPLSPEEAKLLEMYDNGVKLFTREGLLNLAAELDKCRHTQPGEAKITQIAFGGATVEYKTVTWHRFDAGTPPFDEETSKRVWPYVAYNSHSKLMMGGRLRPLSYDSPPDAEKAFLSMEIMPVRIVHHNGVAPDHDPVASAASPFDGVKAVFDTRKAQWEASEQYAQLREILASALQPRARAAIKKLVGFALGGLYSPAQGVASRSMAQHGLILELQRILSAQPDRGEEKVPCFLQDPGYSDLDKQLLPALGMQVLDDPKGFLEVDDASLVLSIGPNVCVKEIIADIARPAAIIWQHVLEPEPADVPPADKHSRLVLYTDPESPRVRKMMSEEYKMWPIPDYDAGLGNDEGYDFLVLFVRKDLL